MQLKGSDRIGPAELSASKIDIVCALEIGSQSINNSYPMSLTTDDLKAIRKVIREEVTTEVKDSSNTLETQIRLSKMEVKSSIRELDDRMKNVEIRMDNVAESVAASGNDIKVLKKDVNFIKKTTNIIAKNYDEGDVALHRRLTKVEKHLNLPQN